MVTQQLALLTISVDRNYAIMNSLRYPTVFTQTLCCILIVFSWTFAVIISIPPLLRSGVGTYSFHPSQFLCGLDWESNRSFLVVFSVITFLLPLIIQSFCYIRIFIAALGHSTRSSKVRPIASVQIRTTSECRSDSSTGDGSDFSEEFKRSSVECKAVRTIFLIAIAYSICWVPFLVDSFLKMNGRRADPNFSAAAICFLFSSSILNPIIYAFMNRVTRREIGRFVCGNSGLNDSDEAVSTSMSAYSTAWVQSRMRTRSNGEANNEMATIAEETEVDDSAFYETRTEKSLNTPHCDTHRTLASPDARSLQHKGGIVMHSRSVTKCEENEITVLPNAVVNIPQIILPEGSNECTKTDRKLKKDSGWNIIKTEKFNEERRKSSKNTDDVYFANGRRRRKRDYGSFLYFENNIDDHEPGTSECSQKKQEKKRPQRYSVDHVQSISLGKFPSSMRFRLSLNESDLKNVNKVIVKSDFKFENKAFVEDDEDSMCHSFTSLPKSPRSKRSTTTSASCPIHSRKDMSKTTSILVKLPSVHNFNTVSAPVSPHTKLSNNTAYINNPDCQPLPRLKSAPACLSSDTRTDNSVLPGGFEFSQTIE